MTAALSREDIDELDHLEESLWRPSTRFNRKYMDKKLAADFFEFGRSGRIYTRAQIIETRAQPIDAKLPLQDFRVKAITSDVALVNYISEVTYDGVVERANRSSLRSRTSDGWRLRFHQGTPV